MSHTKDELYSQVAELVGEMSWGIGLPRVMTVAVKKTFDSPVEMLEVSAEHAQPYFEAIYQKAKASPEYNPLRSARQRIEELQRQNAEAITLLKAGKSINCRDCISLSGKDGDFYCYEKTKGKVCTNGNLFSAMPDWTNMIILYNED